MDQDIIKAIAELDGWINVVMNCTEPNCTLPHGGYVKDGNFKFEEQLPSYLTSRDAVVLVIEKQKFSIREQFFKELRKLNVTHENEQIADCWFALMRPQHHAHTTH